MQAPARPRPVFRFGGCALGSVCLSVCLSVCVCARECILRARARAHTHTHTHTHITHIKIQATPQPHAEPGPPRQLRTAAQEEEAGRGKRGKRGARCGGGGDDRKGYWIACELCWRCMMSMTLLKTSKHKSTVTTTLASCSSDPCYVCGNSGD